MYLITFEEKNITNIVEEDDSITYAYNEAHMCVYTETEREKERDRRNNVDNILVLLHKFSSLFLDVPKSIKIILCLHQQAFEDYI